jgi:hypothetical protein
MNKRIIISESEKKRILSQHKQNIKNESELKKQSLSERELSKLVNRVLIQEQLQVPGLPEGMVECIGNLKSIDLKQQTKIAAGCKDMDVTKCSEAVMSVGVELAAKVISNPSILLNWGKETMEFAKCMSEKFEMDLPIENLASSKTSEMKEAIRTGCKSNSDCGTLQKCINGTCETTTALKESGPCKSDSDCPPNMACYNNKCSVTTSLRAKKPNAKEMKEGGDESRGFTNIIRYQVSPKSKEVKEAMDCECLKTCVCPTGCYCRCKNGTCTCTDSYTGGDCTNSSGTKISKTSLSTVKETEEMNEGQPCPRDWTHCPPANQCCPPGSFCAGSQGCRDKQFRKVPGGPTMTESYDTDEIIYEIEMDEEDSTPRKRCRFYNNRGKCIWDIINPFKEEVEMNELDEEGPLNWLKHKWWGRHRKQDNYEQGFGWMEESEEMKEGNDFGKRKYNRRGDQKEEEMKEASASCQTCFLLNKKCCWQNTPNPKCCDYCGANGECGTRIKI